MKKIFSLFVAMMAVVSLSAKTVYLNPGSSTWAEAGAITFIHAWGGTETVTNVQMLPVKEGSAILSADCGDNNKIVFVRMAPGSTEIKWDGDGKYWNKTSDQTITEGEDMFTVSGFSGEIANGSWSKYVEEEEEKVVLPEVKLAGTMTEWGTNAKTMTPAEDSLSASVTVTLDVATYEFKIVSDGNYLSLNGEGETLFGIHRNWNHADHVNLINDGRNFQLTADAAGEYTFTWTYADSTLVVTFPELPKVAIVGSFNSWNADVNVMVPADNKETASVTIENLEAGEYEMKVWVNGAYLTKYGEGGLFRIHRDYNHADNVNIDVAENNLKLDADVTGNYTFTWTYATRDLVVTFPATTPTDVVNAGAAGKAVKRIVNGQLLITRDGRTYNAIGVEIK